MKNVRLNMEVPSQAGQGGQPANGTGGATFTRVGIIALIGFGVGIAWPRAMGLHLGPAPIPSLAGSAEPEAREPLTAAGTGAPTSSAAPTTSASSAPAASAGPVALTIARGVVLSCKGSDGETLKGRECGGAPKGLDAFVAPHLGKLSQCPGAVGAQGKLSAVITFDFRASRLIVEAGKSSTVASPEPLAKCLKEAFSGVDLPTVNHEHARYAMAFSVQFDGSKTATSPTAASSADPPDDAHTADAPSAATAAAPIAAGGSAEVEWDTARIRSTPKTGEIISRWPKGTKVTILAQQGGWLKVKRDGTSEEGWLYRSALGK